MSLDRLQAKYLNLGRPVLGNGSMVPHFLQLLMAVYMVFHDASNVLKYVLYFCNGSVLFYNDVLYMCCKFFVDHSFSSPAETDDLYLEFIRIILSMVCVIISTHHEFRCD